MTDASLPARTITPRGHLGTRLRDIVGYRELLLNLIRKELRVKYKSSILGFFWSLLNPAMLLVVYYLVFSVVLGSGIPRFPIYLLSGLIVWNLFSVGLLTATSSVVGNAGIVNKVWFPREVLPLSSVGAALVHFFLQSLVLLAALTAFRHPVNWAYVPLLPVALVGLLLVLCAFAVLLSAANVYLRDVQHLIELGLIAWFFASPVVYSYNLIADKAGKWGWVYLANPVTDVVLIFQRAIYGDFVTVAHDESFGWYVRNLAYVYVLGFVLFFVAMAVFRRLEGNFAEEL